MWNNLDPSEQAEYRQLDNAKIEKSRKKFIEKHLSPGEFEEKYGSDFEKVIAEVEKLFKVGCSRQFSNFWVWFANTKYRRRKIIES